MTRDYFAGASTLNEMLKPSSVTADGQTAGLDITDYMGILCFLLAVKKIAGTTPTLDVKLQSAPSVNVIHALSYSGTGNGAIQELEGGPDAIAETVTITMTSATAFGVSGSVSGSLGTGTVGTRFSSSKVKFLITAGDTAFVNTDAFTVTVYARTYTDVSGAAFAQVTTTDGIKRITANADGIGRFIRFDLNIGGTSNPEYTTSLAMLGMKQETP